MNDWSAMQKQCTECKQTFSAKRSDAKYCSALCRNRAATKQSGKTINATRGRPKKTKEESTAVWEVSVLLATLRKTASSLKQTKRICDPPLAAICEEIADGVEALLIGRGL